MRNTRIIKIYLAEIQTAETNNTRQQQQKRRKPQASTAICPYLTIYTRMYNMYIMLCMASIEWWHTKIRKWVRWDEELLFMATRCHDVSRKRIKTLCREKSHCISKRPNNKTKNQRTNQHVIFVCIFCHTHTHTHTYCVALPDICDEWMSRRYWQNIYSVTCIYLITMIIIVLY